MLSRLWLLEKVIRTHVYSISIYFNNLQTFSWDWNASLSWQKVCPLWFKKSHHTGIGLEVFSTKGMKGHPDSSLFPLRIHGTEWGWWYGQCWEELDTTKKKGFATGMLHVKWHKVRNRNPQTQTPTCALQRTGTSSRHKGTCSKLCSYVDERRLSEAMQKWILSFKTWLKETAIDVPVVFLCLSAFKKCTHKCVKRPVFKSLFCRRWFKYIQVQPN